MIKKKYTFFAEEILDAPVTILAAKDGVYEIHQTPVGVFSIRADASELPTFWREGFSLSLPKIPVSVLGEIIAFFRTYAQVEMEVFAKVLWDQVNKEYLTHIPQQTCGKFSVDYLEDDEDGFLMHPLRYTPVLDIHSHNTMRAYFSKIDDRDEVATQLYGVVGRLDRNVPDILFRYGVKGDFRTLHPEELFDPDYVNAFFWEEYPREWHEKVIVRREEDDFAN